MELYISNRFPWTNGENDNPLIQKTTNMDWTPNLKRTFEDAYGEPVLGERAEYSAETSDARGTKKQAIEWTPREFTFQQSNYSSFHQQQFSLNNSHWIVSNEYQVDYSGPAQNQIDSSSFYQYQDENNLTVDYERSPAPSTGSAEFQLQTLDLGTPLDGHGGQFPEEDIRDELSDHNRDILCFGAILNAYVTFIKGKQTMFKAGSRHKSAVHFDLVLQDREYVVSNRNEAAFARLDYDTCTVLKGLQKVVPELRFGGCFNFGLLLADKSAMKGKILPFEVNVYGKSTSSRDVCDYLRQRNVRLQDPSCLEKNISYRNPQSFGFGFYPDDDDESQQEEIFESMFDKEYEAANDIYMSDADIEDIDVPRLRTRLRDHQRHALHFILGRESSTPAPDSRYSLWQRGEFYGREIYENAITGKKQLKLEEEPKGGILADEVGMGKTLSLLSAISATMDDAWSYANTPPNADDETSRATMKCRGTLIVTPLSLIKYWEEEIRRHFAAEYFGVHIYHGSGKISDLRRLADYDIVLTTYQTVSRAASTGEVGLKNISWFRIILDEAHWIRHSNTQQYQALSSIEADRRWCISATPVQNNLEDLQSLVKFLRYSSGDESGTLFEKHIRLPLKQGDPTGAHNLKRLLGCICLHRSNAALQLPPMHEQLREVDLSPHEQLEYSTMEDEARRKLQDALKKCEKRSYFLILQLITKLRMFCNVGSSAASCQEAEEEADRTLKLLNTETSSQSVCGVCKETSENDDSDCTRQFTVICSHVICFDCLQQFQSDIQNTFPRTNVQACPICGLTIDFDTPSGASLQQNTPGMDISRSASPSYASYHDSAKINCFLNQLENLGGRKSIVFSFWRTTLDVIERKLRRMGISYSRLDGTMDSIKRKYQIDRFRSKTEGVRVMLMTTGVGATGLTLTEASVVHIMEPQWNPMTERQAIGRVHRMGQESPVTVYKYIVRNSIEKQVLERQQRKLRLINSIHAETNDQEHGLMTHLNDLRRLF